MNAREARPSIRHCIHLWAWKAACVVGNLAMDRSVVLFVISDAGKRSGREGPRHNATYSCRYVIEEVGCIFAAADRVL